MLPIERELAVAIWGLYAIDCVHWLKPGETAFIRTWRGKWPRHVYREEAFTLLGRMPVAVNPLDLRPGIVVLSAAEGSRVDADRDRLHGFRELGVLLAVSWFAAINLLILVPALLLKGWFEFVWKIPASALAVTHVWILLEVFFRTRRWRRRAPGEFWPEFIALLLNPVGALRAGDMFSKRRMAEQDESGGKGIAGSKPGSAGRGDRPAMLQD